MPYRFVRIFIYFLFLRRQGFRMITFDRQAGPLHNFNKHPKIPPPPIFLFFCSEKKNSVQNSTSAPPPPPHPHLHAPAQSSEHSPQSSCNNK